MSAPQYSSYVNLFHALIIAPFLLYIGIAGYLGKRIPSFVFVLLIVLAVLALLYHSARYYKSVKSSLLQGSDACNKCTTNLIDQYQNYGVNLNSQVATCSQNCKGICNPQGGYCTGVDALPPLPSCMPDGASCGSSELCCSGNCSNGTCVDNPVPSAFGEDDSGCWSEGTPCWSDSECCSGNCPGSLAGQGTCS